MNKVLLAALAAFSIACAKSSEAPTAKKEAAEKEKIGPVAIDPRAAKPMLDKARAAAALAGSRNSEAEDAMKNLE